MNYEKNSKNKCCDFIFDKTSIKGQCFDNQSPLKTMTIQTASLICLKEQTLIWYSDRFSPL